MIYPGLYTALVTPFDLSGEIDEGGFRENIQFQKSEGVDGIIVLGATGEASVLTPKEKKQLVNIAREEAENLCLVAGVSSSSTFDVIENVKWMEQIGVDALLISQPYYNKPTQEGIFLHFKAISSATHLPILVYNQQGRTGVNIETSTLARIAQLPNIVGVKEASGDLLQIGDVLAQIKKQDPEFLVFSGDDPVTFPMMAMGADGVISIVSNLIPSYMRLFIDSIFSSNFEKAKTWHFRLLPFFKAAFFETNPIPIKAAMDLCGFPSGKPRLPLTPLSSQYHSDLEKILQDLELTKCCL